MEDKLFSIPRHNCLNFQRLIQTVAVVLLLLWRFHARGHVEVADSPWEAINVERSAREQLPGMLRWVI